MGPQPDDPSTPNLRARFRGALLGVAIGDALGAPFEGAAAVSEADFHRCADRLAELRYTDDAHMTIGVARALLAPGGFDGARLVDELARNYRSEPWRGYGPGPPQVFQRIAEGTPWDQAARTLFGGAGSYGNGAAMRVAPAALAGFPDLDRTARLARETALVTHAHPVGVDGAILQACAIGLLLAAPPDRLSSDALRDRLQDAGRRLETAELREALGRALDAPVDLPREQVVRRLGNEIAADRSVPAALYSFLRHRDDFPQAVRFAVLLGGDADTIAAMTGALAGAYLGQGAIPDDWRRDVEGAETLRRLADELYARQGYHSPWSGKG